MSTKISILLSTYNGERYLSQQIDSIIHQSCKDWDLYIRDDGSSDNTLQIIEKYCTNYSTHIHFLQNSKHKGVWMSFLWLLEQIESDYYMFCDQDDIWFPEKIEKTYKKMKAEELNNGDKAIIVCSDLVVVDEQLQLIHNSMWEYSKIFPKTLKSSFKYLSVCNFVTGCTMMINNKAKEVSFPFSSNATLHDNWIALKVLYSNGIISPVYEPTILYRQHGKNVCGAAEFKKSNYLLNKIKHLFTTYNNNMLAYKMANSAGGISVFSYIVYKINYYAMRQFNLSE